MKVKSRQMHKFRFIYVSACISVSLSYSFFASEMSASFSNGVFACDSDLSSTGQRRRSDAHSGGYPGCRDVDRPRPERRRVNPETLAQKLGPEVVADLQACILPGMTEMPSFEIRKRIQQRHNIDRRHIYDWFHAMGLRVVKEEKSGSSRRVDEFKSMLTVRGHLILALRG
jgi:hypothetical protein